MLDALSDFWKPAKKEQPAAVLNPEQLQIGSSIGFGFVPQVSLSGRRMNVSAINTYQFGEEKLTSFVLSNDKDPSVSMIVAESSGEKYLAISRRLTKDDKAQMFDSQEVDNVLLRPETTQLFCKNINSGDYKGWIVAAYKRELQGMNGRIYKGDFRKGPLPAASAAQEFKYALLVSESNEHAIEIEKYTDGRVEMYATVYRRVSDIGEVLHPSAASKPDIKLATVQPLELQELKKQPEPAPKAQVAPPIPEPVAPVAIKSVPPAPVSTPATFAVPAASAAASTATPAKQEEKTPMQATPSAANGAATPSSTTNAPATPVSPSVAVQSTAPEAYLKQEVKAVSKVMTGMDSDSVECDLRVANKIIEEAIRNEMRLGDVVRRIIELPVAYPEAVHIPVTLSDDDYALLAIRYGISSTDRGGIKRRILEDLSTFSGGAKKAA